MKEPAAELIDDECQSPTIQHPINGRLAISFSGGRTSAVMTKRLLDEFRGTGVKTIVTFANTGCEHEATLQFVRDCDVHWGFNTVWLEADYLPRGEGISYRIVTFDTASRNGEPFESYIKKYGIPNKTTPGCSHKLKKRVQEAYYRIEHGWRRTDKYAFYSTAIGIRADEIDRLGSEAGIWYPLAERGITKEQVNKALWDVPWDLKLPSDAYGNCKFCWKKSDRKLLTLALESPDVFDFPRRMEEKYGDHMIYKEDGEMYRAVSPDGRRHFYRNHRDSTDIMREAKEKEGTFKLYRDRNIYAPGLWDNELDLGGGCEESCEAY